MKHHEELVADWLLSEGHVVRHMSNGEDPPDLVVDGNIAVEVTTMASYAHNTLWGFLEGVCKSLGRAENGRGYWIYFEVEDEALLQHSDKGRIVAIKRDLRAAAKAALRKHYANPLTTVSPAEETTGFLPVPRGIALPHGVELRIWGAINNNRDNVKYKVGGGGEAEGCLVVPHLIDAIQSAVRRKTAKSTIKERAEWYRGWWLAVTDPYANAENLDDNELRALGNAIHYGPPWERVILVNLASDRVSQAIDLTKARA